MGLDLGMARALSEISVTDNVIAMVKDVRPSKEQYGVAEGVLAMVATYDSSDDYTSDDYHAVEIAEVLNAEDHKLTYPDYMDRLAGGWLLCHAVNSDTIDDGGLIGWFGRVELITLDKEQYDELHSYISGEAAPPDDSPDWLMNKFVAYADHVAAASPDSIARAAKCSSCGGRRVQGKFNVQVTASCMIGESTMDGVEGEVFTPISDMTSQRVAILTLHCMDCKHEQNVPSHKFATRTRGPLFSYREQTIPKDHWP